jgi:hypothetical protein
VVVVVLVVVAMASAIVDVSAFGSCVVELGLESEFVG